MLDVTALKASLMANDALPLSNDRILTLALVDVRPDENQPRKVFDDDALQTLAISIKEHGLIQPIVVRQDPNVSKKYIIVAGERRYRAVQLLGETTIKAILLNNLDEANLGYVQVIENLKRSDLRIEELAQFICDRISKGDTQIEISKALDINRSLVARYALWNNFLEAIHVAVKDGRINSIQTAYNLHLKSKDHLDEVQSLLDSQITITYAMSESLNKKISEIEESPEAIATETQEVVLTNTDTEKEVFAEEDDTEEVESEKVRVSSSKESQFEESYGLNPEGDKEEWLPPDETNEFYDVVLECLYKGDLVNVNYLKPSREGYFWIVRVEDKCQREVKAKDLQLNRVLS